MNGITEDDNKAFSFYLSKDTMLYEEKFEDTKGVIRIRICNVFVNRVCLYAVFLYVICVMSVLKTLQSLCCMLHQVPNLNKTF